MEYTEFDDRCINVHLTKAYKHVINKNNRKGKSDYVLNVDKITKEKFECELHVMNNVQAFLLNYEIRKLLDKVITIDNCKYKDVIYVNKNMSVSSIMNLIVSLNKTYKSVIFTYNLYCDLDDDGIVNSLNNYKVDIKIKAV